LNGSTITGDGATHELRTNIQAHFPDGDVPVTVSMKFTAENVSFSSNGLLIFCGVRFADGTTSYFGLASTDNYNQGFGSFTVNKKIVRIDISQQLRWTGGTITIDYIQIEEGTTATAYTPFIDVNGATLQRYGKNLLPKNTFYHYPDKQDNYYEFTNLPHGTYTLSGWVTKYPDDTSTNTRLKIVVYYTDNTTTLKFVGTDWNNTESDGIARYKSDSVTTDTTKEIKKIEVSLDYSALNNPNRIAENVMLEFSSTATEFEPYVKSTPHAADENGIVKGIIDNGEAMTLIADSGATISAEYLNTKSKITNLEGKINNNQGNIYFS
jgi:hypothetical protein